MKCIECYVADTLKDFISDYSFPPFIKLHIIGIKDAVTPSHYSLLVLDINDINLFTPKEMRFKSESKFDTIGYVNSKYQSPDDIIEVCETLANISKVPGVLTHQQILSLMKLRILIYDGSDTNISSASYDLSLDKEHLRAGVEIKESDVVTIDSFDYVVVIAKESVNIPKNICGTFDLSVSMFCRGILLSNGPQIDPGYCGRLLCLLFNTSSKEFSMQPNQGFHYATIQFQGLTTSTNKPYDGKWNRKKSVKDYIVKYVDKGMSDRVRSITSLEDQISILSKYTTEHDNTHKHSQLAVLGLSGIALAVTIIASLFTLYVRNEYIDLTKSNVRLENKITTLEQQISSLNTSIATLTNKDKSKPNSTPKSKP